MRKRKQRTATQIVIKSLLLFSIPILMILYVMPGPDGKPVMGLHNFMPDEETVETIEAIKTVGTMTQAKLLLQNLLPQQPQKTLYKWQDKDGIWQLSEQAPENIHDTIKPEASATINHTLPIPASSSATIIYKWQDKKGRWHFSENIPEYAKDIAQPMAITDHTNTINLK